MKRRVVITGIGPAAATGLGKKDFFHNLYALNPCISEIPKCYEQNYNFKSRYFVPKPEFSLTDWGVHKSIEGMMEEISRFSVLGAKLALEDAGFNINKRNKYFQVDSLDNCAVIIGIGMSSLQTALESYAAHIADTCDTKHRFNRMVIPMLMPNSAAAWISILFAIKGFSYTVNASCASGSIAIGEAYRKILSGRCDAALTGGVEVLAERNGAMMRGFDMLTTLTRSEDGRPLPFSNKRSGFLLNEGAGCVLVLEELQTALKRGAHIYAEIVGYECSNEAYSIMQIDPSGENITGLLQKLTKGINVDYINAHGTATVANDEIEAKVIQNLFGVKNKQPYINSTKGILGHSIGASGAIEAAVTAMAIKDSRIHGNLTTEPMDELNLPLESIDAPINYAITASYGFGGHNALILLKRFNENE
ncbi:MAG: beta-ketoacyl-[acyl-carrier-protein] synthase family protein [Firmicutes bacterium]|nr:beta-ketoacyl-[acyl-carrier-protein] synthase family protein [Bacillota bacterium]